MAEKSSPAPFQTTPLGSRALARGGAFVSLGDDPSILFINPAGMWANRYISLYCDYGGLEGGGEEQAKASLVIPWKTFVAGGGYVERSLTGGGKERLFLLGVCHRVTQGTQGSFLSVGANLRLGRMEGITARYGGACPGVKDRDTKITGDLGMMIRPLPMISFGYAVENVSRANIESGILHVRWERIHRWGMSWLWKEKIIISWERSYRAEKTIDSYGFNFKTGSPLEIMTGFSGEGVSGGLMWDFNRLRLTASFSPDPDKRIFTLVSVEFFPRRPLDVIYQ
ncbi:MAG: hypothetical protein JXB45_08300 [Candidatus Krumholzibacteriota bacterium]|nr:hypothetical protein [Candidatus Krumholzibacteriota bacterium]